MIQFFQVAILPFLHLTEKGNFLPSLCPSICRMMEQSLLGEVMKTQDLPGVVVSVSRNPHGYKLGWDFLKTHWHTLIKKSVCPGINTLHFHF